MLYSRLRGRRRAIRNYIAKQSAASDGPIPSQKATRVKLAAKTDLSPVASRHEIRPVKPLPIPPAAPPTNSGSLSSPLGLPSIN
jgi:hypothetical protein